MPAISFNLQFLDALLRGDKQQTTRRLTDRIKVGDTAQIYLEQRRAITAKPLRTCTSDGKWIMRELMHTRGNYPEMYYDRFGNRFYPHLLDWEQESPQYYAHFLGEVQITGVDDILPCEMSDEELDVWARDDGFNDFDTVVINPAFLDTRESYANWWFSERYGNYWMERTWTVIKWNGWAERYFEPKP